VRDPDAHREAARLAVERGPLEVWVNNAGVLRTRKTWEHTDEEVRLLAEVNVLGVMRGSRAAIDAMRERGGQNMHVINLASLSALAPVPGLAVYAATKHAVLGFTGSLGGDLRAEGLPITAHVVCPDGADTDMTRERAAEPDSAIIWSAPRMLSAGEVADAVVALLDSKQLMLVIPRWRGWLARSTALAGRHHRRRGAAAQAGRATTLTI
jgi:short-subunit dehydrogenase